MRKIFLIFLFSLVLTACGQRQAEQGFAMTDALGHTCQLPENARVVSCYGSFSESWLLSGGSLVGVTSDAVEDHGLDVGDAAVIGSVKHVDLEQVTALEPDYVILSADLTAHLALQDTLDAMGIPYGYFRVDVFADYKALMSQFCAYHDRQDLFQKHVLDVEAEIAAIQARIPETEDTVLLLRAYSTGMKVKTDDNLAGQILSEYGLRNIADIQRSILEDLSLEAIVRADPDHIFILTMGDENAALAFLEENAFQTPAWQGLTAIQKGQVHILPKELFHYKPNHRWSESYAYIANCIWP